ncbi:uncharacterized protein APUU_30431A [Aspergillus puulaauensis]|uniref:Uncharacterized protein n=1 Tax=Aspergillus puulaauensis TaxID=1220207 RepID=A0A7R7XIU8_9EURO|nr:uncharacterized protein APUU_30431A [Aspergillus puulaauensis]BCS22206.1 hypothetical protein APUU_30431A [Aspergillus puulaauensis]
MPFQIMSDLGDQETKSESMSSAHMAHHPPAVEFCNNRRSPLGGPDAPLFFKSLKIASVTWSVEKLPVLPGCFQDVEQTWVLWPHMA